MKMNMDSLLIEYGANGDYKLVLQIPISSNIERVNAKVPLYSKTLVLYSILFSLVLKILLTLFQGYIVPL